MLSFDLVSVHSMHPPPLDILTHIALGALLSSCTAGVTYALCRLVERWSSPFAISPIITAVIAWIAFVLAFFLALVLLFGYSANPLYLLCLPVLLAFWDMGAFFHLKSGGSSNSKEASFYLIVIATLASVILSGILMISLGASIFRNRPWAVAAYCIGAFVYPTLAPMALTIRQSLIIRPSVDEAKKASPTDL
jgi:hypothetical protein